MNKSEVIAEIKELISREEVGPLDITVSELMEEFNFTRHKVLGRMNDLVSRGLYGKGKKFNPITKRECIVYWKVLTDKDLLTDTAFDGMMEEDKEPNPAK